MLLLSLAETTSYVTHIFTGFLTGAWSHASQFLNASKTNAQLTKSSGARKASEDAPQSLPLVFLET